MRCAAEAPERLRKIRTFRKFSCWWRSESAQFRPAPDRLSTPNFSASAIKLRHGFSRFGRKPGESRKYDAVSQNASPRNCVPKNTGVSGGSENGPRASHHDRVPPRPCPGQACVGVRPFGTCPGLFAGFGTTVGVWPATMLCACESMNAKMPVWRPSGSVLNQSSHP